MVSRREFLDRSGRFALGVAAVPLVGPGRELTLSNPSIAATWTIVDNTIRPSTLTNRLLHGPSQRLRQAAERGEAELLDAARLLFAPPD